MLYMRCVSWDKCLNSVFGGFLSQLMQFSFSFCLLFFCGKPAYEGGIVISSHVDIFKKISAENLTQDQLCCIRAFTFCED